jgi:hypothetical protein
MTAETRVALRLGLAVIGIGGLLGALVGVVYGAAREATAAFVGLLSEDEEPA